jgi:peroxiredoxin
MNGTLANNVPGAIDSISQSASIIHLDESNFEQAVNESSVPEKLRELYRQFGHPLDLFNGPDGAQHLPVPATFLIDQKGVIRLAHVDADYTRRLDPEDAITSLRELTA